MYIERVVKILDDVVAVNPEATELYFATKSLTCTLNALNSVLVSLEKKYLVIAFDVSKVKIIIN